MKRRLNWALVLVSTLASMALLATMVARPDLVWGSSSRSGLPGVAPGSGQGIPDATWAWQNPLPQGHNLNSVKFDNSMTGWVVEVEPCDKERHVTGRGASCSG